MIKLNIRQLHGNEFSDSIKLAVNVFMQFEAPEYSRNGIESFLISLKDKNYLNALTVFGAFKNDLLVGMIATRNNGEHIALFFVKADYQGRGVGRKLFEFMASQNEKEVFTVNSSPYAVGIYKSLGFIATDCENTTDGIRYTPMMYFDKSESDKIADNLDDLCNKDVKLGCLAAEHLAELSADNNKVYKYMPLFFSMLNSDNSYIRNRALSLISSNSKWDCQKLIDAELDKILSHITDEKPITSRQCVKALGVICKHKPYLSDKVYNALINADLSKYNESMLGLIESNIETVCNEVAQQQK